MSIRGERKQFRTASSAHRPIPVWQWDASAAPEEQLTHFEHIIDHGLGGIIVRNAPSHLDERAHGQYTDTMAAIAKRARKRNVSLWLEHGDWRVPPATPGVANTPGAMYLSMESFRVSREQVERIENEDDSRATLPGDALAAFVSGPSPEFQPVLFELNLRDCIGWNVLLFRVQTCADRMNFIHAAATQRALDAFSTRVPESLQRHLGQPVTHFLISLPALSAFPSAIPWDPEIETFFQDTRGYSLLPHLPALFYELPDCHAVRFDYWTLIAEMFREGCTTPLKRWADEQKIRVGFGRAPLLPLHEQVATRGPVMPLYPGEETLEIYLGECTSDARFEATIVAIKEAASVSRQLGPGGVTCVALTTYEGAWPTPEELRDRNLHFALGATRVAAPQIDTRRAAMPGPHQPYWPFTDAYWERLARTGWILQQGERICELLVIHPAASVQAAYSPAGAGHRLAVSLDAQFRAMSRALLEARIDFDYGDEEILAQFGRCEPTLFVVGSAKYRVVVLPPMLTLRESTLDLLVEFASGGGQVFCVGSAPRLLAGRPSEKLDEFVETYTTHLSHGADLFDYRIVLERLYGLGLGTVDLRCSPVELAPRMLAQRSAWAEHEMLYIANTSGESVTGWIDMHAHEGEVVEEWELSTGQTFVLVDSIAPESPRLQLEWAPYEAKVLLIGRANGKGARRRAMPETTETRIIQPEWTCTRTAPNLLPLSECLPLDPPPGSTGRSATRWRITVSSILPVDDSCGIVLEWDGRDEGDGSVNVSLNGIPCMRDTAAPPNEEIPAGVPLKNLLPGDNILELEFTGTDAGTLGPFWITGNFWVAPNFFRGYRLEFDQVPLGIGAWTRLGFPFYAGTAIYRAEIEGELLAKGGRALLELHELRGVAEVRVNGTLAGQVVGPPHVCDLSTHWRKGPLTLEIEVASSLENRDRRPVRTDRRDAFREFGLLRPPRIVLSDPAS